MRRQIETLHQRASSDANLRSRLAEEVGTLSNVERQQRMALEPRGGSTSKVVSTAAASPVELMESATQNTTNSSTGSVKLDTMPPQSKNSLGHDLLVDAENAGKNDIKAGPVAGIFCDKLVEEMKLKEGKCNTGSRLSCNGYLHYCQIQLASGEEFEIELGGNSFSCAEEGVLSCENAREKLNAENWLKEKREQEKAEAKKADAAAWQMAKFREKQRKQVSDRAAATVAAGLKKASDAAEKEIKAATVLGHSWLPQPKRDREESELKTEIRKMKFRLMGMEHIFVTLRSVAPTCDQQYKTCGANCDKAHPMDIMKESQLAIMGKVTPCQMKCKEAVIECTMKTVDETYKDVTDAVMTAAQTKPKET